MSQVAPYKVRGLILLGFLVTMAACSTPNTDSILNPATGKHSATWYVDHRTAFLKNQAACNECHGSDLHGGISGVSCFSAGFSGMTCHASGPSGHPAGWSSPTAHGASAKAAPNAATTSGFSTCQTCHGSDFSGGISTIVCASCHGGSAPHPTAWITGTYVHTNTDTGNAPVCALCHTGGANSPIPPPPSPAPGATPGCFNNTLCHAVPGHAVGWSDPTVHGASAKAAPNSAALQGFSTCQTCHGTDFSGGISTVVCASCHGGSAPHPTAWITGTYVHTNTDTGNAPVCALCHTGGANSPIVAPPTPAPGTPIGCFNNTLCHAAAGHPAGWSSASVHGPAAKAAPDAATMKGFSTCQTCHGTVFSGGTSTVVCSSCHGGSAPHPTSWVGGTYTHTNTNTGNAAVCALCHANGANSPISPPSPPGTGAPGCFNSTLCHANP
jgi:DnaJ-class molecular chaperone